MVLIDFITHSEVVVNAAADDVWPFIIDLNRSSKTQHMISISGLPGEVGERIHVVPADHPELVTFCLENVEVIPGVRRTMRLETPDGKHLGFTTWVLRQGDAGTTVGYHVYGRYEVPEEALQGGMMANAQREMDAGLELLKAAIEARDA